MAGKHGNHGGKRIGAGRPPGAKNKIILANAEGVESENLTPLEFMLRVMNDPNEDVRRRVRAAISALPFCHPRAGGIGKKEAAKDKAAAAGGGKFAPSRSPLGLVK